MDRYYYVIIGICFLAIFATIGYFIFRTQKEEGYNPNLSWYNTPHTGKVNSELSNLIDGGYQTGLNEAAYVRPADRFGYQGDGILATLAGPEQEDERRLYTEEVGTNMIGQISDDSEKTPDVVDNKIQKKVYRF